MAHPSLKAQQSERTKAALVASGRELFARHGYGGVSAEEVARAADVTTGAVYHQFGSKRGLFVAVFEAVEADLTAKIAGAAAGAQDPWAGLAAAAGAFIAAATEPDVRQVVLIDGRSVLGWDEWHDVMARYGLGLTRAVVQQMVDAGMLRNIPIDAFAATLFGALSELALFVATASDGAAAAADARAALSALLDSLRS